MDDIADVLLPDSPLEFAARFVEGVFLDPTGFAPSILVAFLEGSPIYRILHFAFIGAIVFALVVIKQRRPRPWCLIASTMPLLIAGFAEQVRWLMFFHSEPPRDFSNAGLMFFYDMRFFAWGVLASGILGVMSLVLGQRAIHSSLAQNPQAP